MACSGREEEEEEAWENHISVTSFFSPFLLPEDLEHFLSLSRLNGDLLPAG